MTSTTIHLVAGIQGVTLMVFYTEFHCWQFRIISSGGAVFGERKLYYSAEAALKRRAGLERSWEVKCNKSKLGNKNALPVVQRKGIVESRCVRSRHLPTYKKPKC